MISNGQSGTLELYSNVYLGCLYTSGSLLAPNTSEILQNNLASQKKQILKDSYELPSRGVFARV